MSLPGLAVAPDEPGGSAPARDLARAPDTTRLLSPRVLPLPRMPRWAAALAVGGALLSFLFGLVGADGLSDLLAFGVFIGGFRLGAWLEDAAYRYVSRRGRLLRLVLVGALPILGIAIWVGGGVLAAVVSPLDRGFFHSDHEGPLAALAIALTFPLGAWVFGASIGSISITFIDVVVSGLVQGFRARITLAVGLLVAQLSSVFGVIVYLANALQEKLVDWRGIEGLSIDVDSPEERAVVENVLDSLAAHPLALTGVSVSVGLFIGLPSVISACTKLADAVLERILPLMHAFDAVAEGERQVRVEEAGSRELTELARHFNRMIADVDVGERMERAFGMYVGGKLLDRIRENHADGRVPAATKDATVWFADIRSFTTMSEQLEPEVVVKVLNRYFDTVLEVIDAHDGFLDKFIGDAVVVVFNGPIDQADHALRGVRCAVAMLEAVDELNAKGAFPEVGQLNVGAGVNSGAMVAGNIGSSRKVEYTVIGDAVNLASRVEGMTKAYGARLLITDATLARLGDDHGLVVRRTDRVAAKGKARPVDLYEVLDGQSPAQRERRLATCATYEAAFEAYLAGDLAQALEGFSAVCDANPDDAAATLLRSRCEALQQEGLPEPWDGVLRMHTK